MTMMTNAALQAHMKSGKKFEGYGFLFFRRPAPCITCADGFILSVQASATHYCTPRDNEGPYTTVEIGFPSGREEVLEPYGERWNDDDTPAVFAYVPIEVALEVINKHGGVK